MREVASRRPAAGWLDEGTLERLTERLRAGLRRARATGSPALVSVTAVCPRAGDPSALVVASRRTGESWFCLEQPEREGCSLAALGSVRALQGAGPDRFVQVARAWGALTASALADAPDGPPGSGLVAVGGFAFAPDGGGGRSWSGYAPASLLVPELSFARRAGRTWLTANVQVAGDDTLDELLGGVRRRLGELRDEPLPLLDPAPTGRYEVRSPMPPSHYEQAVARAVQMIRGGELQKVVLAREVEVNAPVAHDPAAILGVLREAFPSCYVFAVGRGESTFVAASPELLVRREGQRASTVALAGSARRSADPAVDAHLGEQLLRSEKDREENAIVARRIVRTLRPHAVWVTAAPEPALVRVANIQHLATPIRAQLTSPVGAIELAGMLHPTPAVGGEPSAAAQASIPTLEGLDRGWYTGPVGWTDMLGDGEFCVALRCALLRGRLAHCFSGCGIVRDSEPAAELAETELKLGALLPVLAG
ncbi:MAG: isochorismate synthase [Solirubrobacterales bacterium]|nr:MAG: isochorismate synthase [Solirubrobacterales bacterium]